MSKQMRFFTPKQANTNRLATLEKIARVQGYTKRSLSTWKLRYEDFPKPVGFLIQKTHAREHLYSAEDVVQWIKDAQIDGRIRWPQGPMPPRQR